MSSKANSSAIRRRVGASAVPNITAPAPTYTTSTTSANTANTPNPSTDRVHIGDLIVSHDRALAELRRTVAEQAEQIAVLMEQIAVLMEGVSVELDGDETV